jgi:hypothetical protein
MLYRVSVPVLQKWLVLAAVAASALAAGTASAAPATASGQAYDIGVNISIANISVLSLTTQHSVQFADEVNPYEDSSSAVSFDSGSGPVTLARLTTGNINVETQWIPSTSFLAAGSRASIADVDLEAVSALSDPLLTLKADLIQATAIVTGTCPPPSTTAIAPLVEITDGYVFRNGFDPENLEPSGQVEVPGIDVAVEGTGLLDVPVDPGANTTIPLPLDAGSLILNEQSVSGDGITSRGVASNAAHLNLSLLGTITADVILSHAEASIQCH